MKLSWYQRWRTARKNLEAFVGPPAFRQRRVLYHRPNTVSLLQAKYLVRSPAPGRWLNRVAWRKQLQGRGATVMQIMTPVVTAAAMYAMSSVQLAPPPSAPPVHGLSGIV